MVKPPLLTLRLLILAAVLVAIGSWVPRHTGVGAIGFGVVAIGSSVLAMLTTLVGLLEADTGKVLKALRATWTQGVLFRVLDSRCLVPLALSVALAGSLFSTVTVRGPVPRATAVRLTVGGESAERHLTPDAGTVQFLRMATPLGRPMELKVDGYLARTIELEPWTGTTVRIEDLAPSPTLLVRVPPGIHQSIDKGTFRVTINDGESRSATTPGLNGSLLLGPRRPILPASIALWEYDLPPRKDDNAARRLRTTKNWLNAFRLDDETEVAPGDRVTVEFLNADGKVLARLGGRVTSAPFQDLLMEEAMS